MLAALFLIAPHPFRPLAIPVTSSLPSTEAALRLDLRPLSAGVRQALRSWSPSDLKKLGPRGQQLGQLALAVTPLVLDLKKDVLPWFGGQAMLIAVGLPDLGPLDPDSSSCWPAPTARGPPAPAMERGARPYLQESDWHRFVVEVAGEKIVVWRNDEGQDQAAYVIKDGCVLLTKHPVILEQCLHAAQPGNPRLAALRPDGAIGKLPAETLGSA